MIDSTWAVVAVDGLVFMKLSMAKVVMLPLDASQTQQRDPDLCSGSSLATLFSVEFVPLLIKKLLF